MWQCRNLKYYSSGSTRNKLPIYWRHVITSNCEQGRYILFTIYTVEDLLFNMKFEQWWIPVFIHVEVVDTHQNLTNFSIAQLWLETHIYLIEFPWVLRFVTWTWVPGIGMNCVHNVIMMSLTKSWRVEHIAQFFVTPTTVIMFVDVT